jgi:hypothetical protein
MWKAPTPQNFRKSPEILVSITKPDMSFSRTEKTEEILRRNVLTPEIPVDSG